MFKQIYWLIRNNIQYHITSHYVDHHIISYHIYHSTFAFLLSVFPLLLLSSSSCIFLVYWWIELSLSNAVRCSDSIDDIRLFYHIIWYEIWHTWYYRYDMIWRTTSLNDPMTVWISLVKSVFLWVLLLVLRSNARDRDIYIISYHITWHDIVW